MCSLVIKASNNKAEYKVLLAILPAAKYVGVIRIIIHSNSQLLTRQLEGMWKMINDRLCKYIEAYERMKAKFQEVILQNIPREENKKADELARMTNAFTHWVEEGMVVRVKLTTQINRPLTPKLNQSEEVDWREVTIAFLK